MQSLLQSDCLMLILIHDLFVFLHLLIFCFGICCKYVTIKAVRIIRYEIL